MFKKAICLLLTLLLCLPLFGILAQGASDAPVYTSPSDLSGKKIGCMTGSVSIDISSQMIDGAEIVLYNTDADVVNAVAGNKVAGSAIDSMMARYVVAERSDLSILPLVEEGMDYAAVFQKDSEAGSALCAQFNAFLAELEASGERAAIESKWVDSASEGEFFDFDALPAANGTLRIGTCSTIGAPPVFYQNGSITGMDMELIYRFCEEYGYGAEIQDMEFSALFASVASGKSDLAISSITITEERRESVLFSDPYFYGGVDLLIRTENAPKAAAITDISQLENAKIAVWSGSICELMCREKLPNAQYVYFNTLTDLAESVAQGKTDAMCVSTGYFETLLRNMPELTLLDGSLGSFDVHFLIRPDERGKEIQAQLDEYLASARASGEIDRINALWRGEDESVKSVDFASLTGENGTIRLVTCASSPSYSYIKDEQFAGSEVDIVAHFCAAYGYDLTIENLDFAALTPSVAACKCDIAIGGFEYSEERAESVTFSGIVSTEENILIVRSAAQTEKATGFAAIAESFAKTFIRENRWKLFLQGIGQTMLITLLSLIFGTALGFAVYMLCRRGGRIANAVSAFAIWLIRGMPIVVLLMIFYYIIFGNVNISGMWVAVICFTLSFACSMFGMLRSGVGAIDNGQMEGARALGYTDRQAFYKVILPQAVTHFLPAYRGEIVALIQATAVVGYIAVQDLTKASDIIRSRTYEPFFPLIATAAIYFVLAGILTSAVKRIEINTDPRRRSKEEILKGLKGGEKND